MAMLLALALSATPGHVRPGAAASARIAVACPERPRIFPSAGIVAGPFSDGASWSATFFPPRASLPRVALIGVLCGSEAGLLPVPIWGDGDAEVHARPRATVEVRIGEAIFGPLRTDARGIARVPVVVPPGVDFAYQGPRAIDLHVPPTRTVHLIVAQEEVAVDQKRTVPLWAFAVDRAGTPREGAPLRFSASRGALSPPVGVAPGVYRLDWSFEPGAPGDAQVEATVEGDPEPARAFISLVAGEPASIELSGKSEAIVAGDGPVRLHAVVRDAAGNLLDRPIRASATLGALRVSPAAPGHHELEAQAPAALGGARELRIAVAAGAAKAEARIPLEPAPASEVRIEAARSEVLADGRSAVVVRLRALDRFGNEVRGAPAASSSTGTVSPPARGRGGWEATFVPPVLHETGNAMLDARAGGAAAVARIELAPSVRPAAVAFRAGVFSNFHEVTGPMAGVVASLRTNVLGAQLGVAASFDALGWNQTAGLRTGSGDRQLRTALGVLLPGLSAEWRVPLSRSAAVWAQGGPLLAVATAQTQLAGADPQRDRGTEPGLQAGAGGEMRLWRGRALVELRWLAVKSFALTNLQGPLSGLCASAGYRVELF